MRLPPGLDKLEELRRDRSEKAPGIVFSKADVARAILWEAIAPGSMSASP